MKDALKFKLNTIYSRLPGSKGIVTHAGTKHADELLSIALLEEIYGRMPIIRTYDLDLVKRLQRNKNWWVLDIGRECNLLMKNADHHQDKTLPATNMLLLDAHEEHFSKLVTEKLKLRLFNLVSDIDVGKVVLTASDPAVLNTLVRWCNSLHNGFFPALNMVRTAFKACLAQCRREVIDAFRWETEVEKKGHYAIVRGTSPIICWEELAQEEGICYLLKENVRRAGSYSIQSINAKKLPIPKMENGKQIFLHNSGFLASYISLEAAEEHVKTLKKL